jgi:hypothetical protein
MTAGPFSFEIFQLLAGPVAARRGSLRPNAAAVRLAFSRHPG